MDARPDVLAEQVRAKRMAVDDDLEVLRGRLQKVDPRRIAGVARSGPAIGGLAVLAGTVALVWWLRRRRSYATLDALLIKELSDLLATEERLVPALAEMSRRATNPDLAATLDQYGHETASQVERLTRAFHSIGAPPRRGACDAMNGVLDEADRVLRRRASPEVRDAWLIASAQRGGHLAIAAYGTARSFAATLGHHHAARLLQHTLEEKRIADERFTRLATRFVNPQSARGDRSDARPPASPHGGA